MKHKLKDIKIEIKIGGKLWFSSKAKICKEIQLKYHGGEHSTWFVDQGLELLKEIHGIYQK